MADFYENLSQMENEAMRRARHIHEAERKAAQHFQESEHGEVSRPLQTQHEHKKPIRVPDVFGSGVLNHSLFSSPDFSLILVLILILKNEKSDPLLMLALVYILM